MDEKEIKMQNQFALKHNKKIIAGRKKQKVAYDKKRDEKRASKK